MATTLQADSFSPSNIRERSQLVGDAQPTDTEIALESTQGITAGDFVYVGNLGREGCEKAVVEAVTSSSVLTLAAPLQNAHRASEPVTSVLGNLIHIYRAANVGGSVPPDSSFTVLATREIDPDQTSTYYNDTSGGSDYWYKKTYYNAVANVETALADAEALRGSDFGHYASISEIRSEAGFDNAYNLKDSTIDQQRRAAESEINSTPRSAYTVPFVKPIPQRIRTLTIQLAAGLLQNVAYSGQGIGDGKVKDARAQLKLLQGKADVLDDDQQTPYTGTHVNSWPNDATAYASPEMGGGGPIFSMGDRL